MPPYELWLTGRAQIQRWYLREPNPCRAARVVAIEANGSPAFAIYHTDERRQVLRAFAILILTIRGDRIAAIDLHIEPRLFGLFDLPTELAGTPAAV